MHLQVKLELEIFSNVFLLINKIHHKPHTLVYMHLKTSNQMYSETTNLAYQEHKYLIRRTPAWFLNHLYMSCFFCIWDCNCLLLIELCEFSMLLGNHCFATHNSFRHESNVSWNAYFKSMPCTWLPRKPSSNIHNQPSFIGNLLM